MNFLTDFFVNNFQDCLWLAIILVSIIPTLESKIAIPFAMNSAMWGSSAMSPVAAMFCSLSGSLIPCFIIMIIARKLKGKTAGFFTSKFISHYHKQTTLIEGKNSSFKKYLALAGFVAIPLPLTGVWTGSFIAGLSNLSLKYSFISILVGSTISSAAITLLCTIFTNSISYILIISLIIIIVFLFIDLFISMFKRRKDVNF